MGLLALLSEGDAHGYQLKAAFEERTGGIWPLNVGQVYTTLDRLAGEGLVEPVASSSDAEPSGRDRRTWHITESGRVEVGDWFTNGTPAGPPPRDELLVKVVMAMARTRDEALAVIDSERVALYRRTQDAQPSRRHVDAGGLAAEAVAFRLEADLRWLDHCETVILSTPGERPNP